MCEYKPQRDDVGIVPTLYYKCVVGAVHEPPVVIPSEGVSLTRNLCAINTQQNYNFAD